MERDLIIWVIRSIIKDNERKARWRVKEHFINQMEQSFKGGGKIILNMAKGN